MVKYIVKDYFAEDLMTFSKLKIIGNSKRKFSSISTIDSIKENSLIYINDEKYFNLAINSVASVIVIPKSYEDKFKDILNEDKIKEIDKTFILTENPKLVFAYASGFFKIRSPAYGIDKTVVSRSKIDKKTVEIAPYVNIGKNVKLGKDVIIGSFVSIGDNCNIGNNTVIFSGVKIYENVEIGKNCIIHSNTVIGSDGFGFVPDNESYQKIEHLGKIIIEDNVEIGSNCSIDRATIGETRIKKGTKIDNLVQIAHNVNIGENTIICAQVGIAGGASLGNHVTCAGQVGISDHAMVEDNVIAGAQAGLTPKRYAKNSFLLGTPAIDAMVFKKSIVLFYQLPDLVKKIYRLEELIKELDNKLKNQ